MRKGKLLAVVGAVTIAAAACGSSGARSGGGGTAGSSAKAITIGVLTDRTGPAASGNKTSIDGVKAGVVYASRQGYAVKYVIGDTQTSPAGALSAARKLVTRDHVSVVIAHSALTSLASRYLTSHNVPVIGVAEDGPEWITAKNMFSVIGAIHTTRVSTTTGAFFKTQGVTNLGSLGYKESPTSAEAAKAAAESARHAGIKVGYLNAQFHFGSTDVAPIALAMKKAGVDGISVTTDPNTAFALVTALRNQGVHIKAALLAAGYGGDLLQAGAGALNSAQNVYFSLGYEPVEMQTAATKQFSADLKAAGVTGAPTYAMYNGYTSVGLLVQALKTAGTARGSSAIITALAKVHDFDALGLYGSHKLDINDRRNVITGVDNCAWVTKLEGSSFTLVKTATPICGAGIPGKTVSPS